MLIQRDDGDALHVEFNIDRRGWSISQLRLRIIDPSPDPSDPEPELLEYWAEVAFVASWSRQLPGDLPWQDAADAGLSDSC